MAGRPAGSVVPVRSRTLGSPAITSNRTARSSGVALGYSRRRSAAFRTPPTVIPSLSSGPGETAGSGEAPPSLVRCSSLSRSADGSVGSAETSLSTGNRPGPNVPSGGGPHLQSDVEHVKVVRPEPSFAHHVSV